MSRLSLLPLVPFLKGWALAFVFKNENYEPCMVRL
jgi:hypothetical protein